MMKSKESQFKTSRAFCQNLRGILDKSLEEQRWEVVKGRSSAQDFHFSNFDTLLQFAVLFVNISCAQKLEQVFPVKLLHLGGEKPHKSVERVLQLQESSSRFVIFLIIVIMIIIFYLPRAHPLHCLAL